MKRPQRVKTGFKVDGLLEKAKARAEEEAKDRNKITEKLSSNFLSVVVLGLTDGHACKFLVFILRKSISRIDHFFV